MLSKLFAFLMSVISLMFPFAQVEKPVTASLMNEEVVVGSAAVQGIVRIETVEAKVGETVEVGVFLDENPGFVALRLFVEYDATVMTLTSAEDLVEGNISTFGKDISKNPYTLLWVDALSETNYTVSGEIAKLVFDVSDAAKEGSYGISVSVDEGSTFDKDINDVYFMTENGGLLIANEETVPVKLVAAEGAQTVIDDENGYIYGLDIGISEDSFRADYIAVEGDGRVEITYVSGIGTGTRVTLIDNGTQETVAEYEVVIFGDYNGDGNISATDITALKGIIGGADSVNADSVQFFALDVSGDGALGSTDTTILNAVVSGAQNMSQIKG